MVLREHRAAARRWTGPRPWHEACPETTASAGRTGRLSGGCRRDLRLTGAPLGHPPEPPPGLPETSILERIGSEVRNRAVRLVWEKVREHAPEWAAVVSIAETRKAGGGGGNRTRVRGRSTTGFYTLSRFVCFSRPVLRRAGSRGASPLMSPRLAGPAGRDRVRVMLRPWPPPRTKVTGTATCSIRQRVRSCRWRLCLSVSVFFEDPRNLGVPPVLSVPRRVLSPPTVAPTSG